MPAPVPSAAGTAFCMNPLPSLPWYSGLPARWLPTFVAVLIAIAPETFAAQISDRGLAFLEARVKADPDDFTAWNLLAERYLAKLRETGDNAWSDRAGQAADASLKVVEARFNPGGLGCRARVDLAMHRFIEARDRATQWRRLQPDKSAPLETLGDALFELGDLEEAAGVYEELRAREGDAPGIEARLAKLALSRGKREEALAHFTAALELARAVSPEAPQLVAWCEVQLGELAFRAGQWEEAESHYQAALVLQPGGWAATEHLAELRGAQGRAAEAIRLYEEVISKTNRPELSQALGDLYLFLQRNGEAKPWHDRALAAYLADIEKGHVRYLHHLAGFYCDSRENPAGAVEMARRDLALRHTAQAHEALAGIGAGGEAE